MDEDAQPDSSDPHRSADETTRAFAGIDRERLGIAVILGTVIVVNPAHGSMDRLEHAATARARDATPIPVTELHVD